MPGIIVGVDGSGNSQRALEWAVKEAAVHHAALTVVSVHQAVAGFFGSPVDYPGDEAQMERARQAVQAETEKVLAETGEGRPASVTVRVVNGFPAEELVKAGEGADMIVLGSRGAGGFSRLLMGSVTFQVSQHAHCPVLIVPSA
jgi:nucleotide-binding universal stress UspA family protein